MNSHMPRRGVLAWIVFIVAIVGTLVVVAGCVTVVYGETFALL